jgi:phospholipase/carboxylesterase
MAPVSRNEPWLSSAVELINDIVGDLHLKGIKNENIYFTGFSQGACLTLEYVARNARRYGGIAAFTGGLIGENIDPARYSGDFKETPFFIGTSDPDPHVPLRRVDESVNILSSLNGRVTKKVYPNMGHTINMDEINMANRLVFATQPI